MNLSSVLSIFGMDSTSPLKKKIWLSIFSPFSSATTSVFLYICYKIRELIKYLLLFSSDITKNTSVFCLQSISASIAVSKHSENRLLNFSLTPFKNIVSCKSSALLFLKRCNRCHNSHASLLISTRKNFDCQILSGL